MKCKIEWINDNGEPTPDENDAIGFVWTIAHTWHYAGLTHYSKESEHFPICEEHAKRMNDPGMEYWRIERTKQTQ